MTDPTKPTDAELEAAFRDARDALEWGGFNMPGQSHAASLRAVFELGRPKPLTDDQLTRIVWKLAPSARAEAALIRERGPYDVSEPTHLLRRLADEIIAAAQPPSQPAPSEAQPVAAEMEKGIAYVVPRPIARDHMHQDGYVVSLGYRAGWNDCCLEANKCAEMMSAEHDRIVAHPPKPAPEGDAELREQLEALLDIWDDGKRPDGRRAYVQGALALQFEEARADLVALQKKRQGA